MSFCGKNLLSPSLSVISMTFSILLSVGSKGNLEIKVISSFASFVKKGIDNLVKGFGGEPGVSGQYITQFAMAIPREVGLKSNFGLGRR